MCEPHARFVAFTGYAFILVFLGSLAASVVFYLTWGYKLALLLAPLT